MFKFLNKLGTEGNFLNLIKGIYQNVELTYKLKYKGERGGKKRKKKRREMWREERRGGKKERRKGGRGEGKQKRTHKD